MPELPLVSIIIPTYNRAAIIGETLESILQQTYINWECIVVDDGSSDNTNAVLKNYVAKDKRISFCHRPTAYLQGGNGARNYGFNLSKGEYIQWFDSDDLMIEEAIEVKVKALQENHRDVVVSKSKFLNSKSEFYHYAYASEDITFESFAIGNVSWVTDDFMVKRAIAEKIRFNEKLKAGQEYNYCCKMLLLTSKVKFLNQFLTLRRDSENSIGTHRKSDKNRYLLSRFQAYWINYLDVSFLTKHKGFNKHALLTCMSCYLRSDAHIPLPKQFNTELFKVFGPKTLYFLFAKWSKKLFGKHYFFYKKLKS